MKKKNIYILLLLVVVSTFLFLLEKRTEIKTHLNTYSKFLKIISTIESLDNIDISSNETLINSDNHLYNVKFLPESYLLNLDLSKYKLKDSKNNEINHSFFLEAYKNKIILTTSTGNFYFLEEKKILDQQNNLGFVSINSNLDTSKLSRILDIFVNNEKIFVSLIDERDKCQIFKIYSGNINLNKISFKEFFVSNECGEYVQAGRMKEYVYNDNPGLLVTTHNDVPDNSTNNPQDEKSLYGKILHIDYFSKKVSIISKGHRNSQGLFVDGSLILSTEHGPQGGDEINKIIIDGNYGWPIASYGKPYNDEQKDLYKKNHEKFDFIEPIFSFVPSIAISEIVKIPHKFYSIDELKNIFFVSSLNGRSLYFIKFDDQYERLIFIQKIFIGERIRDIIYIEKLNIFLLALEETFSLGALKVINQK